MAKWLFWVALLAPVAICIYGCPVKFTLTNLSNETFEARVWQPDFRVSNRMIFHKQNDSVHYRPYPSSYAGQLFIKVLKTIHFSRYFRVASKNPDGQKSSFQRITLLCFHCSTEMYFSGLLGSCFGEYRIDIQADDSNLTDTERGVLVVIPVQVAITINRINALDHFKIAYHYCQYEAKGCQFPIDQIRNISRGVESSSDSNQQNLNEVIDQDNSVWIKSEEILTSFCHLALSVRHYIMSALHCYQVKMLSFFYLLA